MLKRIAVVCAVLSSACTAISYRHIGHGQTVTIIIGATPTPTPTATPTPNGGTR